MSDEEATVTPTPEIEETDPPRKSGKGPRWVLFLVLVLLLVYVGWASQRKPEAVVMLLQLEKEVGPEKAQTATFKTDKISDKAKEQQALMPPLAWGTKDRWYTYYPPDPTNQKVRENVIDDTNGWVMTDPVLRIYTYRNRYDMVCSAPMVNEGGNTFGVTLRERNMSLGGWFNYTLKNLAP